MDKQDIDMTKKNKTIRKPRGYKIRPREEKVKKSAKPRREPTLIGYMRVSTEKQDMLLQMEAMFEAGIEWDNIYADTISGSKINRKWRDKCLNSLIPGDTLYVWKLDRFSRSLMDLLNKLNDLEKKEVNFVSLTQDLDTSTPIGRMIVQVIGAFAEFEREIIRERVTAGIRAKTASGNVRWGRQPAVDYDKEEVKYLLREKIPQRQIAKIIGISKSTVSNVNKEMKEMKNE